MTFRRWLLEQSGRDDPVGDLARDVRQDVQLGCLRSTSPEAVRRHLEVLHKAAAVAMEAFDSAESEWSVEQG